MSDTTRLATYTTVLVTDRTTGEVISEAAGWTDAATGAPVTDPAWLARLEASMAKGKDYDRKQAVEVLENDDETWTPARTYRDQGNGVWLVRKEATGQVIGIPADRMRPVADTTDKE